MTIQQLEYVLEVNRAGSITAAAKNLFVTQSSVSCAVGALEAELGIKVFERNWQGVVLTDEGRTVLQHAKAICEHHRLMQGREPAADNMVRIETGQYLPFSTVFNKLCVEYRDREEMALVHRTARSQRTAQEKLSRGEVDLVIYMKHRIRTRASQPPDEPAGLHRVVLKEVPTVLRIGPGHRLYHKPDLRPEDLSGDTIIDTPDAMIVKSSLLRPFFEVEPQRMALESDRATRYAMVTDGVGYVLGAKFPAYLDEKYGFRNIPLESLYYQMVCVTNPRMPLKPEVQRYLQLLDEDLQGV